MPETDKKQNRDFQLAFLGLRFFIGLQLLLSGLDKFNMDAKFGGLPAYKTNMLRIADGIAGGSIMPLWMARSYAFVLPWVLLAAGLTILAGIKTRISLFIAALTYTSLSIGLLLVRERQGVMILGVYVGLTAAALCLNKYNTFTLVKD